MMLKRLLTPTSVPHGQEATVAAWSCQRQLRHRKVQRLSDLELMLQVRDDNETGCKAMCEIVQHLRKHHTPQPQAPPAESPPLTVSSESY